MGKDKKIHRKKTLISVIIPAYNIQNYIERCLDSIISSTYYDLEIIVVDDGSTDSTGEICDRFAQKDSRVVALHKENGGLVSARKYGICHAHGEYIAFVDGDDYVDSELYSLIISKMEKYDFEPQLLIHSLSLVNEDNEGIIKKNKANEIEWVQGTRKVYITDYSELFNGNWEIRFGNSVWTKIFRTGLLRQSMNYVSDAITKGEDLAFTLTYLIKCDSVILTSEVDGYYYVQRSSSMTQTYDPDSIERAAAFVGCVCNFAQKEKLSDVWNKVIYNETYGIIMSDCVGCCFKHYGRLGIFSIIKYYHRMCSNTVIRDFYLNGVMNHYFSNKQKENYAMQMAEGHYLKALLCRVIKKY